MAPPRSAFGASPPGGRPQRPGKAGSAASAWLRVALLACLLAVGLQASAAGDSRTPQPVVERARAGTQCVEPAELMRRNHMVYLKHQRDDTVRGGVRGARHSLKACIDCHAGAATRSVNQTADNFCVSCHSYVAVKIDCFECHTGKAGVVAQGAAR
jgi:hypothetical protein